jgi:hypothetical protein
VVSTIDFAGMIYMFAMMSHRFAPLTIALVVWSVLEALAWATGYAFRAFGVAEHGVDMRITLAAMTVGMAYMFLAMQYAAPAMGSMTGMQDLPTTTGTSLSPSPSAPASSTGSMPDM